MRLVNELPIVCFLLASQVNVFTSEQVDPYIIGGEDAKYIPHPWMVSLYFGCFGSCEPQERCQHMTCGGTLISPQWVLTAAHCFEGTFENVNYFQVYVGDYDFMKDNERHERHMAVEQIIQHDGYIHTTTKVENDIALIKLKESVEETPETKCLRLAQNKNHLKDDCHLFGWGMASQDDGNSCTKSHTLKSIDLNRVDLETCRDYYPQNTLYDKNVCAGGVKDQGACFGDSGGGLYCPMKNDDIYELLGIASWTMTNPCATRHKPTVFTDVTAADFRDWINTNCEHCLDNYNEKHCSNSIHMRPIIPTTTTAPPSCEYPLDPSNGHYTCSNSEAGGRVGVGEVCSLHCYNRQEGGSKTCQNNGDYDEDDLMEENCSVASSYCPSPASPPHGHFQCSANDDNTVNSGQVCVFRCYNGNFGGSMQCLPDGSYDQEKLVECSASMHQCPYPPDLPTGHFVCPTPSPGGLVDQGGACVLRCYNGQFASYITCKSNGQYDRSNLEEYKCDGVVTIKTTTTTPGPTTATTGLTTSSASGCPYPDSPAAGTYNCPDFKPGDLVDIDVVCYLVCDNGQFAGSIVCTENGQFDKSDVNEDVCSEEPTTTAPKVTTTLPTPDGQCPYPDPPLPGATYNCPPFNEDDDFIDSGTACYLLCEDGTFAGSAVCTENGQFDESQLEKWKCYPATDCFRENWDYIGHDIGHFDDVDTWMECGVLCKDDQRCTHWTLDKNLGRSRCWIKEGDNYGPGTWIYQCTSGDRDCP